VKINKSAKKRATIMMIPLIDVVFLLLVFFIYSMLSMAVHRGIIVALPESVMAEIEPEDLFSITIKSDGSIFLDKESVLKEDLIRSISSLPLALKQKGVLLFADKDVSYQNVFSVLDDIKKAGIEKVSFQADLSGKK